MSKGGRNADRGGVRGGKKEKTPGNLTKDRRGRDPRAYGVEGCVCNGEVIWPGLREKPSDNGAHESEGLEDAGLRS